jgi:hypothetical protein
VLWSSLAYVKLGALVGLAVLALGALVLAWLRTNQTSPATPPVA